MTEPDDRKPELNDLSKVPPGDLEVLVARLVVKGLVSAETVNYELDIVRKITAERAKVVLETERQFSPEQQEILLGTLESRFETNREFHEKVRWVDVEKALRAHPEKLWSLQQLDTTGGEPDVIEERKGEYVFGDCSAESPIGRRNVVFDGEAECYMKEHYSDEVWDGNATEMVAKYGADFMSEVQYRALQEKRPVDKNTWSWLKTSSEVRKPGKARYGYFHADRIHVNQNSAYDRNVHGGFRCSLRVPKV
jgi:hypothetical protein